MYNIAMKILIRVLKIVLVINLLSFLLGYLNFIHPLFDSISNFRIHFLCIIIIISLFIALLDRAFKYISLVLLSIFIYLYYSHLEDINIRKNGVSIKHLQFNMNYRNKHLGKFDNFLKQNSVDIITLQEVTTEHWRDIQKLKRLYPYQKLCSFYSVVGGVAILSKYPFTKDIECIDKSGIAISRVDVGGVELTVASIHLYWPYPYYQHRQISDMKEQLSKIKEPALISGDFNAAPWSFAVQRVANYSNTKIVKGLRWTIELEHNIPLVPNIKLPIDQLLLSKSIVVKHIERKEHFGSDHYGVLDYLYIDK